MATVLILFQATTKESDPAPVTCTEIILTQLIILITSHVIIYLHFLGKNYFTSRSRKQQNYAYKFNLGN